MNDEQHERGLGATLGLDTTILIRRKWATPTEQR